MVFSRRLAGRSLSRISKAGKLTILFGAVLVLLCSVGMRAQADPRSGTFTVVDQSKVGAEGCGIAEPAVDGNNDVQGLERYGDFIRELMHEEKFKELNCMADAERSSKARFSGGMWKIREFYWAATELKGHPTEEDWKAQIRLVQSWVNATPKSITARVVLAMSYIDYAWDARGHDTSESVTRSGWKLFGQRLEKAKSILDDASALSTKCPEWYSAMQDIALGQEWDRDQVEDLFQRAVAFEPGYYYYYRSYSNYLMPQWNGQEGSASQLAQQSADRLGGDAGDILYFQIGAKIACACNEPINHEFLRMSWPRLQKGYALLEAKYGPSQTLLNSFALMAVKNDDWLTANDAFKRIGDNYIKSVWITEDWFKQNRDTAAQAAPRLAQSRGMMEEAVANSRSVEGAEYQKKVEEAILPLLRQCVSTSDNDLERLEFAVQVGKDGTCDNMATLHMTVSGQCVLKNLYEGHIKNEKPFPPPPHAGYWVDLLLDPAAISAKAAN